MNVCIHKQQIVKFKQKFLYFAHVKYISVALL